MGYQAYLWRMLEPLGVYSPSGYSGGELAALGAALDEAEKALRENFREMLPATAEEKGLSLAEGLFPIHSVSGDREARLAALQDLYQVDHGAFTATAVEKTLVACGLNLGIAEEGAETAVVTFREEITRESDMVHQLYLVELVMPCQIYVECAVRYVSAESGGLVYEKKSLEELRKRTKAEWDSLIGESV